MNTTFITALIGIITTVTGSWVSWFFARKKYNSEVDNNLIENMRKSLDFYMKLSDDNKNRLDEALKRNDQLEDEVAQLRQQVFELMHSMCVDIACKHRKTLQQNNVRKNGTASNKKV